MIGYITRSATLSLDHNQFRPKTLCTKDSYKTLSDSNVSATADN